MAQYIVFLCIGGQYVTQQALFRSLQRKMKYLGKWEESIEKPWQFSWWTPGRYFRRAAENCPRTTGRFSDTVILTAVGKVYEIFGRNI